MHRQLDCRSPLLYTHPLLKQQRIGAAHVIDTAEIEACPDPKGKTSSSYKGEKAVLFVRVVEVQQLIHWLLIIAINRCSSRNSA